MLLQRIVLAAMALATAAPSAARAAPGTVTAAVAANMKPAFEAIARRFEAKHPGVHVKEVYGASGNFFAQIAQGAPFDLFLSADADFPARVARKGLADGKVFVYAYGKLVVWVPRSARLDLEGKGLAALKDPSVRMVAIANPEVAPYGRAARSALEHAGIYGQLKDRLVMGENVSQAAQFVQSGNAQAGFLPLSLARTPPLSDEGRSYPVPPSSYDRIEQAAVVLKGAKEAALARELAAFLVGDESRDVLERLGYDLPAK